MKKSQIIILLGLLFVSLISIAQEKIISQPKAPLISEIVASIDTYKLKTITLKLKLKYVDKIFEKITFYDSKNHDIEFDISSRQIKKRLAADMINIHEGLEYNVTFTIQGVGNAGQIMAELKGFKPVLLDVVPDIMKNSD